MAYSTAHPPEPLHLTPEQQVAYDAAQTCMTNDSLHFVDEEILKTPSIVPLISLHDFVTNNNESATNTFSVVSVTHGLQALSDALNKLPVDDALLVQQEEEQQFFQHVLLANELVKIITNNEEASNDEINMEQQQQQEIIGGLQDESERNNQHAKTTASTAKDARTTTTTPSLLTNFLTQLDQSVSVPRRQVCQHPFKRNDIVWVCRTCQADETCVLCHDCFKQSHHEGHDVAFYHAQAGGCCDCGDADAWDPAGFCPHHGPPSGDDNNDHESSTVLSPQVMERVRGVVPATVDWMVQVIVRQAQVAYARTHPHDRRDDENNNLPYNQQSAVRRLSAGGENVSVGLAGDYDEQAGLQRSYSLPDHASMHDNDDADDNYDDDMVMETNEGTDAATSASSLEHAPLVFSPAAASANRLARQQRRLARMDENDHDETGIRLAQSFDVGRSISNERFLMSESSPPLLLGRAGAKSGGLYIILFADDIHSTHDLFAALKDFLWSNVGDDAGASSLRAMSGLLSIDAHLTKLVRALRQHGHLVVWGQKEFATECNMTQMQLWMDGDKVASTRMGAIALERANRLTKHGLFCSIVTHAELMVEQRAVHVLQWLSALAKSCDPLCRAVAESILSNRHLVPLLQSDFKVSARVTKRWYSLLLTLLAVPTFKSHLAAAYCDTYQFVTAKYARGMGVLERSGYTLSVQFLNRVAYVVDLVQNRDLLGILGKSILETLKIAVLPGSNPCRLDPQHPVLSHRRYSPCISDLKCVLNVKGMPRIFACQQASFLNDWIAALSAAQFMDSHVWRHWSQGHVENESRGWVSAFNASISLGSLFERLLGWQDEETSPISNPNSPYSSGLLTCAEVTFYILVNGLMPWQGCEIRYNQSTPYNLLSEPHKYASKSLPFSTVASAHGTPIEFTQMLVSQVTAFSFHMPLHRFVASCLRELALRLDDEVSGLTALKRMIKSRMSQRLVDEFYLGLMEFPMLVLSRAAQVRAGLWRRNGQSLNDQVLNYAEPPFCRTMRDADLLLLQFAVMGMDNGSTDVAMSTFVHLLLHRLGLFHFVGLAESSNRDIARRNEEMDAGLEHSKSSVKEGKEDNAMHSLPCIYTPSRQTATSVALLEEFLHTVIMFSSELALIPPLNREDHTRQAQWKLNREIIHRLASGSKTHSEMSEVTHVLSYWDNTLLNDQGKEINPDDASGAALNMVLSDVAQRKSSRDRLEPDKWELHRDSWESYDPAFFHISLRSHQTAAENRPKPAVDVQNSFGWKARPYAPSPREAHPFFRRLRRDISVDATTLAVVYRVLHLHCRKASEKELAGLHGSAAYEFMDPSETALARALNFLTLGAYAWAGADSYDRDWRAQGGGSLGSVYWARGDGLSSPTADDWICDALLANPAKLMDSDWYEGEESALILLRRLAIKGGSPGVFVAQDPAVRAGAAWLCNFAVSVSESARAVIGPSHKPVLSSKGGDVKLESERNRRRREAKEKALARMKAQAAKFSTIMDLDESEDNGDRSVDIFNVPDTPSRPVRSESANSTLSSSSNAMSVSYSESGGPLLPVEPEVSDTQVISPRLLSERPRCIICNDEDAPEARMLGDTAIESHRKRSRRRTESALALVGYAQASVVLKGGGGPLPDMSSPLSPVAEFVGTHVTLCGHAVHSDCCESYLLSVSNRDDRSVGKRDEFRCPLCQGLSNILVPFIDVGADWLGPYSSAINESIEGNAMEIVSQEIFQSLGVYLSNTPWWVRSEKILWDGHSAFIEKENNQLRFDPDLKLNATKRAVTFRSLKKHDLYVAWNTVMRTPRFFRSKLRPRQSTLRNETTAHTLEVEAEREESTGETVVWRRLMDQVSDLTYRADSKRLGDDRLHSLFGEFRHYIVEKYAYNISMASRLSISSPIDWPSCLFKENTITDIQRQEMSREKLLSKLLLTIQALTYTICCESIEAKRVFSKATTDLERASVMSKFGMDNVVCDNLLLTLPKASTVLDEGLQPFSGRLGRLRYFALATMAAAGAVALDLVQLVISFPTELILDKMQSPLRCPIAYPLLLGHVLTHVTAAICAICGRKRALCDGLEVQSPRIGRDTTAGTEYEIITSSLYEDCVEFVKLGLLARILQTLLGKLQFPTIGVKSPLAVIAHLQKLSESLGTFCPSEESNWICVCVGLLRGAIGGQISENCLEMTTGQALITQDDLRDACNWARLSACSFLGDLGSILQVMVPGLLSDFDTHRNAQDCSTLDKLLYHFRIEPVTEMIDSPVVQAVVSHWYISACAHERQVFSAMGSSNAGDEKILRRRLFRTEGYRSVDWPLTGGAYNNVHDQANEAKDNALISQVETGTPMQIEVSTPEKPTINILRRQQVPVSAINNIKKSAPLLGGFLNLRVQSQQTRSRPRVSLIPIAYTDLYAELGSKLANCEQIAVCLVCGEVLNASGKGECTRHSYFCGAGAGIFFLLQECSGLIMHKSKAAYIHSPYVDTHGETPQFRGRPLNLDLNRYEHFREMWLGHGVRQMVVAERSNSRQVILNDFY
ncbi:hypothetical protein MPSEU_001035600 [Mayamaea pseudoterrestris]|nr:hypothetical protein MPSEU_001035600 [Mayamaea pseudoterrestris]